MNNSVWSELHKRYKKLGLDEKPNIFAEEVLTYLPPEGTLLELGAGLGQDSKFFAAKGYQVTATDIEEEVINSLSAVSVESLETKVVDLQEKLPFSDASFDVVYSHLSLHYFGAKKTEEIFKEIRRVLKPGGLVAFLVNSINDPEFGSGNKIETEYFEVGNKFKRYLSLKSTEKFTKQFATVLLDDNGETYKDSAKGIHNLIRYIGRSLPSVQEIEELHRKYAPNEAVFSETYQHCQIVQEIALWCIKNKNLTGLNQELVSAGALLHDIGVYKIYTKPGQLEGGNYITHGIRGYEILKSENYSEELCRFASHHTGTGITAAEITKNKLPLPAENFLAETEEERLVMFSDKFHSKDPSEFNSTKWIRHHLSSKFGAEKARLFDDMLTDFGKPAVDEMAELFNQSVR